MLITVLAALCVCLLILLLILWVRYTTLKRQIRHFSAETEKLKNTDYAQPLKVTDFDSDIVELAVKINDHIEIQRQLGTEYRRNIERLDTVIAGISHDFRTPLTAALGYMQMAEKSGELTGKNAEYLRTAINKNKYLKELSDEFFEFTVSERSVEQNTERLNLSNILTEQVLEQQPWMEEKGIAANIAIDDGIFIQSDRRCMERILSNIFSNMQKYAVSECTVSLTKEQGKAVLTASNDISDAEGIDPKRVFEPFYRASSRTNSGSGLGLYVAKTLSDRLGHEMGADIVGDKFIISFELTSARPHSRSHSQARSVSAVRKSAFARR